MKRDVTKGYILGSPYSTPKGPHYDFRGRAIPSIVCDLFNCTNTEVNHTDSTHTNMIIFHLKYTFIHFLM